MFLLNKLITVFYRIRLDPSVARETQKIIKSPLPSDKKYRVRILYTRVVALFTRQNTDIPMDFTFCFKVRFRVRLTSLLTPDVNMSICVSSIPPNHSDHFMASNDWFMTVKSTENCIRWCVYTFKELLFLIKVSSFGSKGHWVSEILKKSVNLILIFPLNLVLKLFWSRKDQNLTQTGHPVAKKKDLHCFENFWYFWYFFFNMFGLRPASRVKMSLK